MSRHALVITGETMRAKAAYWLSRVPVGWRVEFKAPKRSLEQNARMWLLLDAISKQVIWHGERYSKEDWKDYFCHILSGGRFMPDESGASSIPVGHRTSEMSKSEMSDLQTIIDVFCATYGVTTNVT